MPYSQNRTIPRHKNAKMKLGTIKDNTYATIENADAQTKKNCNTKPALDS